jgi:hypothetical protein
MTTSYKLEAQKKLKAEKKVLREQEAKSLVEKLQASAKAHQENMDRLAKKMAIINGEVVEEEKPVKKKTTVKKAKPKKPAAKKRGRPKKS